MDTFQATILRAKRFADLAAATGTTAYPSGATTGVAAGGINAVNERYVGAYVQVYLDITGAGTSSVTASLYGRDHNSGNWYHLTDLGNGAAITQAAQGKSFTDAATGYWVEQVVVGGAFDRYTVRITAIGGASTSVNTFIGFSLV